MVGFLILPNTGLKLTGRNSSILSIGPFLLELPRISGRFRFAPGLAVLSLKCFTNEFFALMIFNGENLGLQHPLASAVLFFSSGIWTMSWFILGLATLLSRDYMPRLKSTARFVFYGSPPLLCIGSFYAGLGFYPVSPLSYFDHHDERARRPPLFDCPPFCDLPPFFDHPDERTRHPPPPPISTANYVFLMGLSVVVVVSCFATAALYALALVRGHRYVSSRTLGGSGVEVMNIVFRGRGLPLESIHQDEAEGADEADQGRIRL